MRARHSEDQVDQHAAVERQFANGGGLDDLADAGVGRAQNVDMAADLYGVAERRQFETDFETHLLADFEAQLLFGWRESRSLHDQLVIARQEPGDLKDPLRVTAGFTYRLGAERGDLYGRARHRPALRVGHRAAHNRIVALRKNRENTTGDE